MTRPVRKATEPSRCRSCDAAILWVTTMPKGKSMPIDAEPSDNGKFIVNFRPAENKLLAVHVNSCDAEAKQGRNRYSSHFETCPNANQHRSAR